MKYIVLEQFLQAIYQIGEQTFDYRNTYSAHIDQGGGVSMI